MNYFQHIFKVYFNKTYKMALLLTLLVGCAHKLADNKRVSAQTAKPMWNALYTDHTSLDFKESTHLFYDFDPFIDLHEKELNYYPIMLPGSPFQYALELTSGKLYLRNPNCKQSDIEKEFKFNTTLPNFTLGVIPRLLTKDGQPQQIIVLGNDPEIDKDQYGFSLVAPRARIIGALIFSDCIRYPCMNDSDWNKTLVPVGVTLNDPRYYKIHSLEHLTRSNIIDFNYVKAYMKTYDGFVMVGIKPHSYRRVAEEPRVKESLESMLNLGHLLKDNELVALHRSCQKLYKFVETKMPTRKELFVKSDQFIKFFNQFYGEFAREYFKCSQIVKPLDIAIDPDKHWLHTYLTAFMLSENMGYIFRCNQQAFLLNPFTANGKRLYDSAEHYKNCTGKELLRSFDASIELFKALYRNNAKTYRYLEYDSRYGGTHQKVYSFVSLPETQLYCADNKKDIRLSLSEDDLFPEDVKNIENRDDLQKDKLLIK